MALSIKLGRMMRGYAKGSRRATEREPSHWERRRRSENGGDGGRPFKGHHREGHGGEVEVKIWELTLSGISALSPHNLTSPQYKVRQ